MPDKTIQVDSSSSPRSPDYPFFSELARTLNSGQSRSLLLYGETHGLFYLEKSGRYVPLVSFLSHRCSIRGVIVLVYELNGPLRCTGAGDRKRLRDAWVSWKIGGSPDDLILRGLSDPSLNARREQIEAQFDRLIEQASSTPTAALEFLRQLTICSRSQVGRDPFRLIIIIEATDMLLPAGDGNIASLSQADRHRISVMQDWFSDPAFAAGDDSVVLITESRSGVHARVTSLPQIVAIEVPSPGIDQRRFFIEHMLVRERTKPTLGMGIDELSQLTAGLTLHAIRQLILHAAHAKTPIDQRDVVSRVEQYIIGQLGEGVVEFSKPTHTLDDVVGFSKLKAFIDAEMIPRMRATGAAALPGAAIAGPIGAGKTFLFEAVAGALGLPVLVLKNIRSQYFGQTDVVFERLRRVVEALGKAIIFVDEADTQFGGVGGDAHPTERRLTGKIQQMMSEPSLRGRVFWLLMTARIELLSADIRRPGRVGELIIPVLDPAPGGEDHEAFVRWMLGDSLDDCAAAIDRVLELTAGQSAAGFAALRSQIRAAEQLRDVPLDLEAIESILHDQLPADIGPARREQELQALLNCTRRSLLPDPEIDESVREAWRQELRSVRVGGTG